MSDLFDLNQTLSAKYWQSCKSLCIDINPCLQGSVEGGQIFKNTLLLITNNNFPPHHPPPQHAHPHPPLHTPYNLHMHLPTHIQSATLYTSYQHYLAELSLINDVIASLCIGIKQIMDYKLVTTRSLCKRL